MEHGTCISQIHSLSCARMNVLYSSLSLTWSLFVLVAAMQHQRSAANEVKMRCDGKSRKLLSASSDSFDAQKNRDV